MEATLLCESFWVWIKRDKSKLVGRSRAFVRGKCVASLAARWVASLSGIAVPGTHMKLT